LTYCCLSVVGIDAQQFSSESGSSDSRIARLSLLHARSLYQEGRYRDAMRLTEEALEFDGRSSEIAYLQALILMRTQATTRQAIEALRSALRYETWMQTDPAVAATELVELYVRTSGFEAARSLILELDETGLGGRGNSRLSALWARTLIGLGNNGTARSFLTTALQRYPTDPHLYELLADILPRDAAKAVLQRGIRELPGETELLYRLAARETDPSTRSALVERYLRSGGNDPGCALIALSAGTQPERFLELFFELGGNSRIDYIDALRGLTEAAEIPDAPPDGVRILDENRDGYYEQRYEYQSGLISRWISDGNQDGMPEVIVDFRDGKPSIVSFWTAQAEAEIRYIYSEYPYLQSAVFLEGQSRREYLAVPYTLERPIFSEFSENTLRLVLRGDLSEAEADFKINAYRMYEYGAEASPPLRRVHLLEGRIARVDEMPDSRGEFTRTIYYTDSLPRRATRDLDGDGIHEISEQYRNGELWKIALDQDGDGMKEFEQVFDGKLMSMYWDYNGDGVYDSRQTIRNDGATVREFSSALNGRYDLSESGVSR